MSNLRVRDIVRTDGPILSENTPMRRATAILVETSSAAAPVITDDGELVGLLSQKDCFRPALHASYHKVWTGRVADHMARAVMTVDADDDVVHVAGLFLDLPHRVFPVLENSSPLGLLYRSDVLAMLLRMG